MHSVFKNSPLAAVVLALGLVCGVSTHNAYAQSDTSGRLSKLEQEVQRLQRQAGQVPGAPGESDGNADMTVRILALERIIAQLTGQIEESKFNADRSAKQLQVLQDDVSLRLARIEQSLGLTGVPLPASPPLATASPQQQGTLVPAPSQPSGPQPIAEAGETAEPPSGSSRFSGPMSQPVMQPPSSRPAPAPTPQPQAAAGGAGDVSASGGFVIRTDAAGRPLPPDPNGPMAPPPEAPMPPAQQSAPKAAPSAGPVTSSQVALGPAANVTLPSGTPKQQYEFAFDFLKRQDYPKAEAALRDFLKRHPKDPLAGNAQYWLGETHYVRGDFQQAIAEFNAGYTNYPKSNKAPDSLLKLGMSLQKVNQVQGACVALDLIKKTFPDAPAEILKSARGERSKLKCK